MGMNEITRKTGWLNDLKVTTKIMFKTLSTFKSNFSYKNIVTYNIAIIYTIFC